MGRRVFRLLSVGVYIHREGLCLLSSRICVGPAVDVDVIAGFLGSFALFLVLSLLAFCFSSFLLLLVVFFFIGGAWGVVRGWEVDLGRKRRVVVARELEAGFLGFLDHLWSWLRT
ncbi:hypothetical protein Golax_024141 [Gossypium laxum]|uniref:Transmembrane protein n=1 Tax=Gossypium laxum TaxID=34288 RepID=A0A7J8ZBD2_9ROSI|nr:hypothetical protein [Gossypium laxum]